jgi:hypothetical protein
MIQKVAYDIYLNDHIEDYHVFSYEPFTKSDSYKYIYKELAIKKIRKLKCLIVINNA